MTKSHRTTCTLQQHALGLEPSSLLEDYAPTSGVSLTTFAVLDTTTYGTVVFIRALSMHLQICWDIVPGRKFFYASQALGWGIPAVLFTATITVTGVSFRFGDSCHVNHEKSLQDFWGWLLAVAGGSVILQFAT